MNNVMAAFECAGSKAVFTLLEFEQKDPSNKIIRCKLGKKHWDDSQPKDKIYLWKGFFSFLILRHVISENAMSRKINLRSLFYLVKRGSKGYLRG